MNRCVGEYLYASQVPDCYFIWAIFFFPPYFFIWLRQVLNLSCGKQKLLLQHSEPGAVGGREGLVGCGAGDWLP